MSADTLDLALFIRVWVWIALTLIIVESYLILNKIWIRKHEAVVSDSVSVAAQLLGLLTGVPFVVFFAMQGAYEGAIGDGVFLIVHVVLLMIGIGYWVEGRRGRGWWKNLKKSLAMERSESTTLLRDFMRPMGARKILQILHELALIDEHFDERERKFLQHFADKWSVDLAEVTTPRAGTGASHRSYSRLRQRVRDYLAMSPPPEQAGQLRDVIRALARIDDNVSAEEDVIVDEMTGLIDDYAGGTQTTRFTVYIAPQSRRQEQAVLETMPGLAKEKRLGGQVYRVGEYYSRAYANMVCDWYRETGFLTVTDEA